MKKRAYRTFPSSFFLVLTVFISADRGHCNKTVDIYEDVSSPAVTPANWGKPLSCWYRFRAFRGTPRDWILRVRFKKFKVGVLENATTCSGGYLQVSALRTYVYVCICVNLCRSGGRGRLGERDSGPNSRFARPNGTAESISPSRRAAIPRFALTY